MFVVYFYTISLASVQCTGFRLVSLPWKLVLSYITSPTTKTHPLGGSKHTSCFGVVGVLVEENKTSPVSNGSVKSEELRSKRKHRRSHSDGYESQSAKTQVVVFCVSVLNFLPR